MMNLEINKNIEVVKKGMLDAIELFKVQYASNKNIIIDKNNTLYINNIEQILTKDTNKDKHYLFGFNFILDNIKNFRNSICINPIIYLLSLEVIINKITNFNQLKKYKGLFKKCNEFILNYYKVSALSKAKIDLKDIEIGFKDLLNDDFIKKVCEIVYEPSNVQIQESKQNSIIKSKLYEIKAKKICGKIYSDKPQEIMFWFYNLNLDNLLKFKDFIYRNNKEVVVLCSDIKDDVLQEIKNISSNISFYQLTPSNAYKTIDLIYLTGADILPFDFSTRLEDYKFGKLKEFIFKDSILCIRGTEELKEDDKRIAHLKKKDTYNRYYMILGKTIKIECQEEIMENVRAITSIIRSLSLEGVFYDIASTLKLLLIYFQQSHTMTLFLIELIKKYFALNNINSINVYKFIKQENMDTILSFKTGEFVKEKSFTTISLYLNTFGLLESNIEVMCKLY